MSKNVISVGETASLNEIAAILERTAMTVSSGRGKGHSKRGPLCPSCDFPAVDKRNVHTFADRL
jgi:hypothetical protein